MTKIWGLFLILFWMLGNSIPARADADDGYETGFYSQVIDHTDPNSPTFQQRYYFSSQFASSPNAPVLLLVGPESELKPSIVQRAGAMAEPLGAYVVAVEHRFYGKSLPFVPVTGNLDQLKYLTVEQALQDLAAVESFLIETKHLTGPWIVKGGSYSATLSAYYRLKFPNLVQGALVSSGPLQSTPKGFYKYDSLAAAVMPSSCVADVKSATAYLAGLTEDSTEFGDLKTRMGIPYRALTKEDLFSVLVTDIPQFPQYGKIDALCTKDLSAASTPALKLQKVIDNTKGLFVNSDGGNTMFNETVLGGIKKDLINPPPETLWFFQTCTQMGWHYTTDPDSSRSLFGFSLGIDYYRDACRRLFGNGIDALRDDVVTRYGNELRSGKVGNMFFTDGAIDPWSTLSMGKELASFDGNQTELIPGASHCSDFSYPSSDPKVKAVQDEEVEQVQSWLR